MIAIDTNILVYAHRTDSSWHLAASTTLSRLAEGPHAWAIPWPAIHEFLGIVTHPRIFNPPTPLEKALAQLEAWMLSPTLRLIGEDPEYWLTFRDVMSRSRVTGPLVHDARIAAICLRWNARELWTADRDFSRFPELTLRNPLLDSPRDSR